MNILINLLLAVLAFVIARYLLALVGLDEAVGWIISVIVGICVFFANYGGRFNGTR